MTDQDNDIINVSYTNWRGETRVRRVRLGQVRFGTTDWHEEPTWLISAFDLDHPAQIWKEFDLSKCDFNRDYMPCEIERLRRLVEMAYNEGVLDVFSRGATIQTAQDFWETADVKQCVLDPTADAELFGSTST